MVIAVGVAGTDKAVFDNLAALDALFPQPVVYNNFTLSPAADAALLVYVTVSTLECIVPESIVALPNKLPWNDHTYPNAPTGNAGAE